jgi:hypothetical protein
MLDIIVSGIFILGPFPRSGYLGHERDTPKVNECADTNVGLRPCTAFAKKQASIT